MKENNASLTRGKGKPGAFSLLLRVVWGAVGARRGERPECEGPRGAVFTSTLGFLLEAGCQPLTEVRVSGILSWFSDRFRIGRGAFHRSREGARAARLLLA